MKNLSEKAMLVNLKISQWSANKYDKKVSQQIEEDHQASNAGRYTKMLITQTELQSIQKISNAARKMLYENTLPWGDNGDRLLPATNHLELANEFLQYKSKFQRAVREFIGKYPSLIDEAKIRLNGMFDQSDYPIMDSLEDKFKIAMTYMPMADSADFRLDLGEQEVNELKDQIEQEIHARIAGATKSIWLRIQAAVSHMLEKLSDEDAKFKNSLVSNIEELIDVLPRLNFTQNDEVTTVINSMKKLLADPDSLRTNPRLRTQKAKEAKAILDKVADFIG